MVPTGPEFRLFSSLLSLESPRFARVALFCGLMAVAGCGGGGGKTTTTPAPAISSLSPTSGAVGTAVTISGSNFGASQGNSNVTFNGTSAGTATTWSTTSIAVSVPSGATTGNVAVTVGGQASNGVTFTVTVPAPAISGLSPASGPVGTSVTISGANFGSTQGSSTVTFNGTSASPTSWTATSISALVPTGATTGNVVVTVGSQASNGISFTVTLPAPTLVSLTPNLGPVGTSVAIAGTNFGSSQGSSTVTFNGTAATPASWSATSIVAPVPSGATTGNVVVTVGGQASNALAFTVGATSGNSVTGTASLGAPIAGAAVTLVDANGNTSSGTTASDGTFTVNSGGLNPPFLVKLVTATSSGSFAAGTTLYSVSADSNVSTHINVHVLSDLIVRFYYAALGVDPDSAFGNPTEAGNTPPTPLAVQTMASTVIQTMQLWFTNAGIAVTASAPAGGSINLISSPFTANDTGLDSVLHSITTETVNSSNGSVSAFTVTGGNVTETATTTYSGGAVTVNATIANGSSGTATAESITGVALTTALQTDVTAISAQLAAYAQTISTDGTGLTGNDLLPYIASDYLNDGFNATEYADTTAGELAGATVSSEQISTIRSINTTTNVADVIATYTLTAGTQSQSGSQEFILKDENGSWLIYGDQRAAQIQATATSRTSQGAPSLGTGVTNGVYIDSEVEAPATLGVTKVTVSGGGNIWNGTASGTLTQGATLIVDGQNVDDFVLLSQSLGTNISQMPAPDTQYTLNLTASSGALQYAVQGNAITTEAISFSGISATAGSGPLSSVVGKTITYNWSLPTTYAIGQVSLFAYIGDGPVNNPATHSCSISGPALGTTSVPGSISIPANMSACGLSASDAIAEVQVFLEVDGVNGEVNLVELSYPY